MMPHIGLHWLILSQVFPVDLNSRERENVIIQKKNDNQYDILPLSKVCAYTSVLTGPVPLALNA